MLVMRTATPDGPQPKSINGMATTRRVTNGSPLRSPPLPDRLDAQAQLRAIAGDATQPAIARATALAEIDGSTDRSALDALAERLRDPNSLVRFGALQSLVQVPPHDRLPLAVPLLSDPMRALRIEAASLLAALPGGQFSAEQRAAFERASAEYVPRQRYNAERA